MNPEIDRLEKQKEEITRKINNLLDEERNFYIEESKKLIGICGIDVDPVHEDEHKFAFLIYRSLSTEAVSGLDGHYFNKYQIPAIFIDIEDSGELPFRDYLFCKALDCDDPVAYISENYEEITQEEFKELYYDRMKSALESAIKESKNEEQSL